MRRLLAVPVLALCLASCGKEAPAPTSAAPPAVTVTSSSPAPSASLPSSPATSVPSTSAVTPSTSPTTAATKTAEFTFAKGKVSGPGDVKLKVGESVDLTITTDAAMTIHAHVFEIEKNIKAGETATLSLTATKTGRYEIEDHQSGKLITLVTVSS